MSESKVNQSPLDQQCKLLLKQKGISSDPSYLYSLQLVIWGLENLELIGPWAKSQTALLEQAKIMFAWKPQIVLKLLMNPDDSDREPGDVELESDDPHRVAGLLIENLHSNLAKVMPAFRD